ncbi:uncharacterized protein LOC112047106 [Bicyclus anynana]|uniref:Regulatory protein zeste n=1 Tax=Bicyclus anynana TaxID=110368 RepID=A0A6J1MVV4_BICAN|nr:uncharacterized protein LOC112047106 [Bicyclus anynana]
MPAPRRLSVKQLSKLVEFAENHRDVAVGRGSGALAFKATRDAWQAVAQDLNSVPDGIKKTPEQWRRYWIEFKAKTKLKAADSRRYGARVTGDGRKLTPLTELERRVVELLGPVATKRLHGVWLPLSTKTESEPDADQESESSIAEEQTGEENRCVSDTPEGERISEVVMKVERSSSPEEHVVEVELQQQRVEYEEPATLSNNRQGNGRLNDVLVYSGPAHHALPQRRKKPKLRQDENVPRWAYNIERRRIAVEERQAAAMEALVNIMRDIRDDIRRLDPNKCRL